MKKKKINLCILILVIIQLSLMINLPFAESYFLENQNSLIEKYFELGQIQLVSGADDEDSQSAWDETVEEYKQNMKQTFDDFLFNEWSGEQNIVQQFEAAYSLGVGVNLFNSMGVVSDLDGKVIYKSKKDNSSLMPNEIIESITSMVEELINSSADLKNRIKGIGIGIGGIVDNKFASADQIKNLANLPSREELYAKVVGSCAAPLSGFVNVLAGNFRGLVSVLNSRRINLEK